jgi:hypothetical protein
VASTKLVRVFGQRERFNVPGHTGIPIDPPSSSNTSLAVEDPELIKTKLVLQLASGSNAGSSSSNNDNGIICICIIVVSIHSANSFPHLESDRIR